MTEQTTTAQNAKTPTAKTPNATSSTRSSSLSAPLSIEEMRRDEELQSLVGAARVSLRRGRKEEARQSLGRALAMNANDAAVLETLGDLCLEDGEHEKAIIAFEKGRKLYPQIAAFEEKIGLAKLDLQEMQDDAILRQRVLEGNDDDAWRDVSPTKLVAYSLLLPGAGHFVIEQNERGAMWLGAAIASFVAWSLPLYGAMNGAAQAVKQSGSALAAYPAAIASMSQSVRTWFWLMFIVWQALYIFSAWDAARCANKAREDRKRALGLKP